ncbi:hypothetical protein [Phenylobacterium sp.]|uniref:hypothetical protein n=1 Tax=Phenylobacterium sp. TaxID=1871053 RepID=UPI002732031C|nr:hypothetical protein [Phenylobacterium sp.]MDP1875542.1 hypothetical protein [Phenylobacterium sp.]MDP3490946.1 hypothetical protein [Phenylobacterium sp.]
MEQSVPRPIDPARLLMWIGVFAFFAGFSGYLVLSLAQPTPRTFAAGPPAAVYAPVQLSPPQQPWVFEKAI